MACCVSKAVLGEMPSYTENEFIYLISKRQTPRTEIFRHLTYFVIMDEKSFCKILLKDKKYQLSVHGIPLKNVND